MLMFFDKKATQFITKNAIRYFFPENVELCVYHMACQVIDKKTYNGYKKGWY